MLEAYNRLGTALRYLPMPPYVNPSTDLSTVLEPVLSSAVSLAKAAAAKVPLSPSASLPVSSLEFQIQPPQLPKPGSLPQRLVSFPPSIRPAPY